MVAHGRSLVAGLIAGALLAVFWQHLFYLPSFAGGPAAHDSPGSTAAAAAPAPAPQSLLLDQMALSLRNALQIAQRALYRDGYKSTRLAPSSLLQHKTLSPSTSILASSTSTTTLPTTTSTHAFSTSSTAMASGSKAFFDAVKGRRSIYALNKDAPISDKAIVDIVNTAVTHVPSSFNSQSARLVVLLGKEHDTYWDMVFEVLKPVVPPEQWDSHTVPRLNGFKGAYGTILFLEDPEPVEALRKAFPIYAHHFGDWSEHTSAMHQYTLWVALEAEGFGANLQHYNPIIDQKVQEHYNIPLDWKLRAQLVFGGRAGDAGPKETKPLESRVFVHGAKE